MLILNVFLVRVVLLRKFNESHIMLYVQSNFEQIFNSMYVTMFNFVIKLCIIQPEYVVFIVLQ